MPKRIWGYVLGSLLVLIGLLLMISYNSLVKKEEFVGQQWNEVQNNYQRRLDLIPNLVTTVKGGAEYEASTLSKVTQARASMMTGGVVTSADVASTTQAQNEVATSVNNMLLARIERYPELKGTKAFQDLQAQLEGTERRIKISRKDFNAAVQDFNTSARAFPNNLVAKLFGFNVKNGFESASGADKAVEIKF